MALPGLLREPAAREPVFRLQLTCPERPGRWTGTQEMHTRLGGQKATDGTGGSGCADRPPGFLPLTWHFRMPARCRPSSPGLGWASCTPRASVIRVGHAVSGSRLRVAGPRGERQRGVAQDLGHHVCGQCGGRRGNAPAGLEEAFDDRPGQLCEQLGAVGVHVHLLQPHWFADRPGDRGDLLAHGHRACPQHGVGTPRRMSSSSARTATWAMSRLCTGEVTACADDEGLAAACCHPPGPSGRARGHRGAR